jgi:HEAT repeat protein
VKYVQEVCPLVSIEHLIDDLHNGNEKTRAFTAEDICFDEIPGGIEVLINRLMVEESRYVRGVIVNCLKRTKDRDVVTKTIPLLANQSAVIRNAGIEILSAQGELATEFMRMLLDDPDKDIRKFALDILFQLKSINSAGLIAEALNDADINNIITAVEYLGQMENTGCTHRVNELFKRTDNILLRCTCLEALALIGDDESFHYINKMYPRYENIGFLEQYSFLKFVARKGTDIHLPLITSLMKDKGQVMHKEIINAIEGILLRNPRETLPFDLLKALSDYLRTDIPAINRYELLVLLGQYRNPEIFQLLIEYLGCQQSLICMGAVEGLGLYGRPEALPALIELKEKVGDPDLSETIEKTIVKLNQ